MGEYKEEKMNTGIKVGDIMTRNVITANPKSTLRECARLMMKNDIGTIIIKDNGKIKGALTEKEIIWALTKKQDLSKIRVSDIMLKKIITIKPSRDIYEALVKMKNLKTDWIPVTVRGNLIGILTINDIIKIEPSLFDIISQEIKIKEEDKKMNRRKNFSEKESWIREGECEECGAYGLLYNIQGRLLCENCEAESTHFY